MKTLFLTIIAASLFAGCATSSEENRGSATPQPEIIQGGGFGMPGSNSGTGLGRMGRAPIANSSQDNAQAAIPSATSYQPNRF
jgi:hypothetical protein